MRNHLAAAGLGLGLLVLVPSPAAAAPSVDANAVKALLCQGKCDFALAPRFVGKDAANRDVFVVGINLPEVKSEEEDLGNGEPCIPEAYSLLHLAPGEKPSSKTFREEITTVRAEGCFYGAGGGSEEVTVENDTLTLATDNGSSWRQSTSKAWRLVPKLTLVTETTTNYSRISEVSQTVRTEHDRHLTRVEQTIPLCGEGEEVNQPDWVSDVIPLAPDALIVDSGASQGPFHGGFVTHGARGDPADAQMRVSAVDDRTVVVEVEESSFTRGDRNWVFDDHVEVWATSAELPGMVGCVVKPGMPVPEDGMAAALPVALQWGVRVTDGAVFAGAGKPKKNPTVVRTELSPTHVRLQIKLPFKPALLSVVYSDSDDGKTQARMIATSKVKFGDARSLGTVARK